MIAYSHFSVIVRCSTVHKLSTLNYYIPMLAKLIPLLLSISLGACSHAPVQSMAADKIVDLASTELPSVSAEFVTTREGEEHEHEQKDEPVNWRLWRGNTRIITERPQLGVGELWQKDGKTIIHRKLYHRYQRAIEFQQDDLRMQQAAPSWQKLSVLVDQALLKQLSAGELEWSDDGYPIREYHGKVGETIWHVVMRMDWGLPMLIERQQGEFSERTELLQIYPLAQAPWQPTAADGYEIIDYADLGDKESDPFVIKVQAQMGHDHHH